MQFGMLIDGEFVTANAEPRIDSINPATLASTGSVPTASATDVDRAVRAAAHAQRDWAQRSVWERAAQLRTLAASIRARGTEILQLEAADTGNTIGKLGADVQIAAGYLNILPVSAPNSKARPSPPRRGVCISRCANPTAWSRASCPSIIRSCSPRRIWQRR